MKKAIFRMLAFLMVLTFSAVTAEEHRHGEFIYVPAAEVTDQSDAYTLIVQGKQLSESGEESAVPLANALFGVYVISGNGEPAAWANPLYPTEPMRVLSANQPVSFSLPSGIDFYLKQVSAPEGYLFDAEKLIPIKEKTITVSNEQEGELRIVVRDSIRRPVASAAVTVTKPDGSKETYETDAMGSISLPVSREEQLQVEEDRLPDSVFPLLRMEVNGEEAVYGEPIQAALSHRTEVEFIHAAPGSVQLEMSLSRLDGKGNAVSEPLPDVVMEIEGEEIPALVTDAQGSAETSLLEGTYLVHFNYIGDQSIELPVRDGQMVVQSGALTLISLSAVETTGRVRIVTEGADALGMTFALTAESSGEQFGPYSISEDSAVVTDSLPAGDYEVSFQIPEGLSVGSAAYQDELLANAESVTVRVQPGQLEEIRFEMLATITKQAEIFTSEWTEEGTLAENAMQESAPSELVNENGEAVTAVQLTHGKATITALTGEYRLRLDQETADKLGLVAVSEPFRMEENESLHVVFSANQARLVLRAQDDLGNSLADAIYEVTDSTGVSRQVTCGPDGEGVTGLLQPGEIHIRTVLAPDGCDAAPEAELTILPGEMNEQIMRHERYGRVTLLTREQRVDSAAQTVLQPMADVNVTVTAPDENGAADESRAIQVTSDEAGCVEIALPAGQYIAVIADGLQEPQRNQPVSFAVENMQQETVSVVAYGKTGGLRILPTGKALSSAELSQTRFVLSAPSGEEIPTRLYEGVFIASDLAPGAYTVVQAQAASGYSPAAPRRVEILGGEVTEVLSPVDEFAVITVEKAGLTFNDAMQTYVVPLEGEYAVYTNQGGVLLPYPNEEEQASVWANVQDDDGKRQNSIRLPASQDGTIYYLKETSRAAGFTADEETHEVTLYAGQSVNLQFMVACDRGFFSLEAADEKTGEHLSGGTYRLTDANGNVCLEFQMGQEAYRNEMALPVGTYRLEQREAPEGYALAAEPIQDLRIESYFSENRETKAQMTCRRIPDSDEVEGVQLELWASADQELPVVGLDMNSEGTGVRLLRPQATIRVSSQENRRIDITGVTLSGAKASGGEQILARVEYAIANGGWQPSDAKMVEISNVPVTASFSEAAEDVNAIRVTYLQAENGEEAISSGFMPGEILLTVRAEGEEEAALSVQAAMEGIYLYRTSIDGTAKAMRMHTDIAGQALVRTSQIPGTESGGKDGRITGTAFLDSDADGILEADESGRYAGLNVRLLDENDSVIDACKTDAAGAYSFTRIPAGTYRLQFASSDLVFSEGRLYSEHVISAVTDYRKGTTETFTINAEHTDYVLNAGCVFAASIHGRILSYEGDGVGGIGVELRGVQGNGDDDLTVVTTDDLGNYVFEGLKPGDYGIGIHVPDGYLCSEAEEGRIEKTCRIGQGDSFTLEEVQMTRSASVSGFVRLDEAGMGVFDDDAPGLAGVKVTLIQIKGDRTEMVAETNTEENGAYSFVNLYPNTYCVQFELADQYGFSASGNRSKVYGAAGNVGSTLPFELGAGERAANVDAGATIPAEMTVIVFCDQGDGIKGPYEKGLEGVQVTLIRQENGEDAEILSAVTDKEGGAAFANVSPGSFVLAYEMPGQWRTTKRVSGNTTPYPVSAVPQSSMRTGRSAEFALTAGQKETLYIGAVLSGTISGTVYEDRNANGALDNGESVFEEVRIELLNDKGVRLAETEPDSSGNYAFEGLESGRYSVRFTAPEGCGFTGNAREVSRGAASETGSNVSVTRMLTVAAGASVDTANASVVRLAAVSGEIWTDGDGDGRRGEDETPLSGIQVELMDAAGRTAQASVSTDTNGQFSFDGLMPGSYRLRVKTPDNYTYTENAAMAAHIESQRSGYGLSAEFRLDGGSSLDHVAYGLQLQGSISGFAWIDSNYNGRVDDGEERMRSIAVALLDGAGEQIDSARTGANGEFSFSAVAPGEHALQVTLRDGYVFTLDGGQSITARSDASQQTVNLGKLAMGEHLDSVKIGTVLPATVSGGVWVDINSDGYRQYTEAYDPKASAVMELRMLSGGDTGLVRRTGVDHYGNYRFDHVMPGDAELHVTLEEGYAFTKQAAGKTRVSSVPQEDAGEATTERFAIESGADVSSMNVGIVPVGVISGRIWDDTAYDGAMAEEEPGIPSASVMLLDGETGAVLRNTESDLKGEYAFDYVRKGTYRVRIILPEGMAFTTPGDSAFAVTDERTQQTDRFSLAMGESKPDINAGAVALASVEGDVHFPENPENRYAGGAVIALMEGGTILRTVKTDAQGHYVIEKLRPGNYRLRYTLTEDALFEENTWLSTGREDSMEGESSSFTVHEGDRIGAKDVETVWCSSISGRAWIDADGDGVLTVDETGLQEVRIWLTDAAGKHVRDAVTDDLGAYAFQRLRAGDYVLQAELPEKMLLTRQNGWDGSSCAGPEGSKTGKTEVFSLAMGEQKTAMNIGSYSLGVIGDSVWHDQNGNGIQDYREPLIPDAALELIWIASDGTEETVNTATTDEYGYYRFENLKPGTYRLRILDFKAGTLTEQHAMSLQEIDSDIDPQTGLSDDIILKSGESRLNVDAGYTVKP